MKRTGKYLQRLQLLRKEAGLTQDVMARKLGVTLSMYEKVESGRAQASAAFMHRVKRAFPGISIDFIFFDEEE